MKRGFLNRLTKLFSLNQFEATRRTRRNRTLSVESFEPRLLLTANLNLITAGASTGVLVYGGTGVDNNTTISYDTGTGHYSISDTAETIAVIGGMVGLDLNADPNIVEFDPLLTPVPIKYILVNGNAGADTLHVDSFRLGAESLQVVNAAGVDTINLNTNLGGPAAADKLLDEVKLAAEDVNLDGSIWTADKGVQVTGPADLLQDVVVSAGTGGATFSSTVNGAWALTVRSGATRFDGAVGGVTPLTGLTTSGTIAMNSVRTQAVTVNGPILFEADVFVPQGNLAGDDHIIIRPLTPGTVVTYNRLSAPLKFLVPGFDSVTLGSATTAGININKDANNLPSTGALKIGSPLKIIAGFINIKEHINQEAHWLTFETDALTLLELGSAKGTGDVTINKLTAGGTLPLMGNFGNGIGNVWGLSNIIIDAPGAAVVMNKALGSAPNGFMVTADTFSHTFGTAINVHGTVNMNVMGLTLGSGIFTTGGDILIFHDVILTNDTLFRAPVGATVAIAGDVTGNGWNLKTTGVGGALGSVNVFGSITGLGDLLIDSPGVNAADSVVLGSVGADSITVHGKFIFLLGGTLSAATGDLKLVGPVFLGGDTTLTGSGLAGSQVRVDGTILGGGGTSLWIDSGLGTTVLGGAISGLVDLKIASGGTNVINHDITVSDEFEWIIAAEQIVNGDNLTLAAGKTITAGTSISIDVIDSFFELGTLTSPLITILEGGNP